MFSIYVVFCLFVFFFKQKTAYEMRISDWSSDVCSSDLMEEGAAELAVGDALEPDVLLALRHLADAVVLDPAQGLAGDLARRVLLARLDEAPGPQKAADVVGAEGALHGHPDVSWFRSEEHTYELQSLMSH